eukprot:30771-Amphidinium_carterae.1
MNSTTWSREGSSGNQHSVAATHNFCVQWGDQGCLPQNLKSAETTTMKHKTTLVELPVKGRAVNWEERSRTVKLRPCQ